MNTQNYIHKHTRIVFLLISVVLLIILHRLLEKSWLPVDSNTTFVFQNLLLMVILGSLLIESKFTKPVDALVNSMMVMLTLLSVRNPSKFIAWQANLLFSIAVFLLSITSILMGEENDSLKTVKSKVAHFSYIFSTFFGNSNLIFSITFILSIFSFYSSQKPDFLILICFWAFIIIAKPIGFLSLLQRLLDIFRKQQLLNEGKILNVILPGFVRFEPRNEIEVRVGEFVIFKQTEIGIAVVTDSYQLNDKKIVQAVIVKEISASEWKGKLLQNNKIYSVGKTEDLKKFLNTPGIIEKFKKFVGVVVENSSVGEITFKITSDLIIEEGNILEVDISDRQVLYQIVNAKTDTELLSSELKAGVTKGIAQQVGIWDDKKVRFEKYGWVPPVHAPLFLVDKSYKVPCETKPNELVLGYIPNTNFPIIANVDTLITHHTAILGITGSGKTEMAFSIIEKMIALKTKVFCVDFTGDYLGEFSRFNPKKLAISSANAKALNEKLLAVETGQFGAGKELGELEKFKSVLVPEIEKMVKDFIESSDHLAVFELSEIANTSATIAITEFYLSQIFSYARQHRGSGQKFCIVLEEAHTVIPESQTMGVQDKYSKATISKISQIALQGRKYSVGLLVIAQRTANVTKTVLNQCNSVIVFNSYDKTGFDFLENYVGPGMISAIPNLKWLQGMVVGRGFKSGRPLIMEIPKKPKFTE